MRLEGEGPKMGLAKRKHENYAENEEDFKKTLPNSRKTEERKDKDYLLKILLE